jgi:hypothetical protein
VDWDGEDDEDDCDREEVAIFAAFSADKHKNDVSADKRKLESVSNNIDKARQLTCSSMRRDMITG